MSMQRERKWVWKSGEEEEEEDDDDDDDEESISFH